MLKLKRFGFIVFLLVSIFQIGCVSKKYGKLALKNEQAGLYEDAAELYLKSLSANKENVESKIGARKNGQITLDRKLTEFTKTYSSGQNKNAVYIYLNAQKYYGKFISYGIELEILPQYEEQYIDAKKKYIDDKYKEAITLLYDEKFEESESVFKEIITLEPNYKEAKEYLKTTHFEPIYRKGKAYFENKMYRKAYYVLDEIIKVNGNYKEAIQYKQDALNAAIFTIWIKEFEYNNESAFAVKLRSSIISQLNNSQNPFIKIIENVSNLDNIGKLKPAFLGVQAKIYSTDNTKIVGANAVLSGKIESIEKSSGYLKSNTSKGYFKTTKTNSNGQKVDEYTKIEYKEYWQSSYVKCFFRFQLISTENGAVLASDATTMEINDELHFATYDGDYSNIVPGYWKSKSSASPEDKITTNYFAIQDFQKLFKSQRAIKSIENMQNELLNKISTNASKKVINYNPEH